MNRFVVFIYLFFHFLCTAQTSEKYNSAYANFYRAEELFEKEQYTAARIEFRNFIQSTKDKEQPMYIKALYYEAISAMEVYNNDAVSLFESFLKNYPESIYKEKIYFRLGNYFYQKKDFKTALSYFTLLTSSDIEKDNKEEYFFKLGYAYFQENQFLTARNAFFEVKDGVTHYAPPALYYYSHIAYMDKAYQMALEGFLKLETEANFAKVVPYYITQIYHLQGKYLEVTSYSKKAMDSINVVNQNDMFHLVGDAYYRLGKFDEAVPYLEAYNKSSKTTRLDDYALGYAYFKSKDYAKASRLFDKVTRQNDSLAQVAFYHIGEANSKLNNLIAARAAFQSAAAMPFDAKIQEDALYNFAVLSYKLDLNPYEDAVIALEKYLSQYPNSKRKNDINQYLVNVYTSTNNYAKALASLDKLPNKDTKLKTAYQLVAYNQGVEFFQKAEYTKAIKSFELVDRFPIDQSLIGRAKFWTADAYFRLNKMDQAIQEYRSFLGAPAANVPDLKMDAYYNLGYAYLKKEDIPQSIEHFTIYTRSSVKNKNKLADAFMRAADGYYMTKQNENAVKNYQAALKLKAGFEDQALYYSAKALGYSGKDDEKVTYLLDIINNYKSSKYILSSIFDVALVYKAKDNHDKAIRYFNQVITDYPKSHLVVQAKIELADIYYKKWDYVKAERDYKAILESYGEEREVCESAVRGLFNVYTAQKQPEKATDLANQYACANISIDEQENLFYAPAMESYVDSAYTKAIPQFEKYLERYPSGKYAQESVFYLANAYFESGNKEQAMVNYRKVVAGPSTANTESSAARLAQHLYNNGQFEEAIEFYQRLELLSAKPAVIFNAKLGIMRCNFLIESWTNAAKYAKDVLANSQINNTLRLEAEYAHGMSNFYLSNFSEAKTSLEWLVKNTTTKMGAEAKYSLAEMYYKQQEYTKSEAEVKALIKMKPSYNFWVAKGLILQTRVMIVQDNLFQAEQTLKSVLEHYPNTDDGVMEEANELQAELLQLKNKPKTIENKIQPEIDVNNGGN